MGIIRHLLLLIFICFSNSIFSNNDTIYVDNVSYVKYQVKVGDSMNSIADYFGVTVNDIIKNNETSLRLYLNQLLYIPLKESRNKEEKNGFNFQRLDEKYNIALLLPFYKNLNDTMVSSFEEKKEADKIIINKSKMALEFMQGINLAIDSLSKIGVELNLVVHDTRNDSLQIEKIIQSKSLDTVDIIIGPLYSKGLKIISDNYGDDNSKIIISPLSRSSDFLKNNKSTIQINTPFKTQSKIITDHIINKHKEKKIIICYDEKEKGLAAHIENNLLKKLDSIDMMSMIYTHVDSVRRQFSDTQIVIIPSFSRSFVSKMLSTLGGIDSSFIVYGLSNIKTYEHLDYENLMYLNVHFPDPYFFNLGSKRDSVFLYNFEETFVARPSRFAFTAYNIMMNFCGPINLYKLERYKMKGGRVNTYSPLVHFKDFRLIKADY
jgi:LysM repeat protein